jgi:hypothetical protein
MLFPEGGHGGKKILVSPLAANLIQEVHPPVALEPPALKDGIVVGVLDAVRGVGRDDFRVNRPVDLVFVLPEAPPFLLDSEIFYNFDPRSV